MQKPEIRLARVSDAETLLAIYTPYVCETAITFEYTPPSLSAFRERIVTTLKRYPYLVAELGEDVLGYAYAGPFKTREAYNWSAEASVYVRKDSHGKGIGSQLYKKLEALLKRQEVENVYACITYPNPESIVFHEHMGYKCIGHFTQCGYKFDTWYDMVWMEKMLGVHEVQKRPFIPVSRVK